MNPWILAFGISCLLAAWLIRQNIKKEDRKRTARIWAMLPEDVKEVYRKNG